MMSVFRGEADLDHDGWREQQRTPRAEGEGVYQVSRLDLGEFGAVNQLNRAALDDGLLRAEWGTLRLEYAVPTLGLLEVPLRDTRWSGLVTVADSGVFSVDQVADDGTVLGGIRVSGHVRVADVFEQVDAMARQCDCVGIDPSAPVFRPEIAGGRLQVRCAQDVSGAKEQCRYSQDGFVCHELETICGVAGFIPALADISTGETGADGTVAYDAFSAGLRLSLAGATLADPPLAPPLIAAGDQYALWDGTNARLDVLANDTDLRNGTPRISGVSEPAHGTVEVIEGNRALRYRPDPGYGPVGEKGVSNRAGPHPQSSVAC